jgi:hypothetical protein
MTPGWIQLAQIFAGAGGLGGIASLLAYRIQRRQATAEVDRSGVTAARELSETAVALLGPYRRQVNDLTRELADARGEIEQLRAQLERDAKR